MAIPAVLRSLGADPAALLAEAGLDPHLFDEPDNLMSLAARGRLFAHCVSRTGCRHFGLLVGQAADLHSLGLVGLLAKFSPDVATALRSLTRHFHLHMQGAATTLEIQGASALLCYEINQPRVEAVDQQTDGAVAVMLNIMRGLCGAQWKPAEVWFQHRRPADVRPFSRFFGVTPRFDAERNALVFPAIWLSRRLADTDPRVARTAAEADRQAGGPAWRGLPGSGAQRAALGAGHRARRGRPGCLALLHAQTHVASASDCRRHQLSGTRGSVPLRDGPTDARGLGDGRGPGRRPCSITRMGAPSHGHSGAGAEPARRTGARRGPSSGKD